MFFPDLKLHYFFAFPPLKQGLVGGRWPFSAKHPNYFCSSTPLPPPPPTTTEQQLELYTLGDVFRNQYFSTWRSSSSERLKSVDPLLEASHTHTVVHTLAQVQPQHGRCGGGRGRLTCTTLVLPSRPHLALVDRDCRVRVCSTISVRSGFPPANFHLFSLLRCNSARTTQPLKVKRECVLFQKLFVKLNFKIYPKYHSNPNSPTVLWPQNR